MSKAFDDWIRNRRLMGGAVGDYTLARSAFNDGRAYQREVDAETASSMWISTDIDTDETIYSGNVGDAIREQKID